MQIGLNDFLRVWIYPPGELNPVLCGILELVKGRHCLFSYDRSWLERPHAFALSPDIPLLTGIIEPAHGLDVHPIFEDAGPDRWGKSVINRVLNPKRRSPIDYLELAGENRIGSLGFSRSPSEYAIVDGAPFHSFDLQDLILASEALALKMPIDENLRRLLRPGSSAGGARPKSIIQHEGQDWIAKFQAEGDEVDVCAVEHASLSLSRLCGINAAESSLLKIGKKSVLLVKRFDREHGARIHFASARTMLLANGVQNGSMGYADIADIVRRLSPDPVGDCRELFRRMAFNVFIENTDDHEKNHAFLFRNGQWGLSPAYDILPQLQGVGFHQLNIGKDGSRPGMANILSECERFLLQKDEAEQVIGGIFDKVRDWRKVFSEAGVSESDIDLCANFILRDSIFDHEAIPGYSPA